MPEASDYVMDFRKEEKPEGGLHVKEGVRKVKIGKTKVIRSSQKGTIGLSVPLFFKDKGKTKKITERLWMSPKAFHRFRELLEACGKKAPAARADIRKIGKAVEGEEIYANFVDDEQEGYATKSVVAFQGGFISPDDYEDDDADEDEDDDDDEDDDLEDDEDEELEEDEDDEEDEDEEDEPPARKRRKKTPAKKAAKKTRRKPADDDEDDDELDLGDFE